nr:hypothetical protein [Tanacetum cinerariifolium]
GTGSKPGVPDVPTDESEEEISWNSTDDEGADDEGKVGDDDEEDERDDGEEGEKDDDDENKDGDEKDDANKDQEVAKNDDKDDTEESRDDDEEGGSDEEDDDEETRDDESFDPIPQTPKNSDDEGNGEEDQGLNIGEEERLNEDEEADELYRDVDINQGRGIKLTQEVKDSHVTLTLVNLDGQQESSSVSSHFVTSMLNTTSDAGMESIFATTSTSVAPLPITSPTITPSTIATITATSQAPILPTTISSDIIQHLPSFGSLFHIDDRLRPLEEKFSKFRQTNQFVRAVSAILGIVHQYMDQQMNEAVRVAVQIQSDWLRDEAQKENDEFLRSINENIKKIIKEQVKEQVKMEGNKSIQRSDEQRNLYKAVVKAYEADKIILDIYRETVTLKKRRDDDADKDEGPSARLDRGLKRCIEEEPVQTTSQMEEPSHLEFETDRDWNKTLPAVYRSIQPWISKQAKQADTRSSFNELMDTPLDFSNFLMNRLRVDTLTPELLAGPTYELIKGSCKSLIELEYHLEEVYKATTDQLDWVNPKELKIMEWHSYKHLDWIIVRRDNDKLYKFKEGDFKRLRLQDIKDMLLLLVQGKLNNLTVEERLMTLFECSQEASSSSGVWKTFNWEGYEELGKVRWRKAVRGRLQDATKDYMIYRMLLLSYK